VQSSDAPSDPRHEDPARPAAWARLLGDAVRLDRSALDVVPAARCAVGIAIPLVAGELSGHVLVGVEAAIGALTAGMASLQGTYRSRVRIMAFAVGVFALSAFVGATVGHLRGPDIAVTAAWGAAAGFLVVFGQAPSVVGLQAVVGLVVFSQFTFGPGEAALTALWALCGGTLQVALVAATWPLQRFPVERHASSTAYGLLATHLGSLPVEPSALLDPSALDELRATLRETQPWGDQAAAAAFLALADEADRINLEAARIARVRARLVPSPADPPMSTAAGDPTDAAAHAGSRALDDTVDRAIARQLGAVGQLDDALVCAASVLATVAAALHDRRSAVTTVDDRDGLRRAVESLRRLADAAERPQDNVLAEGVDSLTALAGQLRSVLQLTAVAAGEQSAATPEPPAPATTTTTAALAGSVELPRRQPPPRAGGRGSIAEVTRANLTRTSESFRHALRVGVTLAVAVAVAHLFPLGHGYWLPMTVMIVLKPDFAATLARGIARSVGTLVGAGAVTLLLAVTHFSSVALILLTVVLYAASVAVLRANYVLYSVGIASLVVVLLAFLGSPAPSLAGDRAFYTVVGAALALAAYAIWPTWERTKVADRLAELVEVDGHYGAALLHAWSDPAGADLAALHRLRLAARLARSNAEASVDRWLREAARHPGSSPEPLRADQALGILAAVRRYVWGALALHSRLTSTSTARVGLDRLGDEVDGALATVAATLRTGSAPTGFPALRSTQVALAARLLATSSSAREAARADVDAVLASETDLMVDAVDTLAHLVGIEPGLGE